MKFAFPSCVPAGFVSRGACRCRQVTGDVIGVHDLTTAASLPSPACAPVPARIAMRPIPAFAAVAALEPDAFDADLHSYYKHHRPEHQRATHRGSGQQPLLELPRWHRRTRHTVAYGAVTMTGSMSTADVFGTNLQTSHPFSLVLPLKDYADLAASLVSQGKTADPTGAVQLIQGNIECTSCHDPHVQAKDTDLAKFSGAR